MRVFFQAHKKLHIWLLADVLLLAAFGFGKSSEKLNTWFKNTRLYRENLAFRERLSAVNYPGVDFAVEPGAGHSWDFWDRRIAEALTFFNRVAPRG